MNKLTEAQRAYLVEHVDELWAAFYDGDPDLLTSTCGCCQDKREFVKKVLATATPEATCFDCGQPVNNRAVGTWEPHVGWVHVRCLDKVS